jgi:hypothetical protein
MGLAAPVVPIAWLPKFREAGNTVAGTTPIPLSAVVWEEVEPLSLTVNVPVRVPSTEGVKVAEILQFAPAAKVLGAMGQVEVSAKSPDAEMLLMVSADVRVLVRVMLAGVLVVCTTQFPKLRLVGLRVWAGALGAVQQNTAASPKIHGNLRQ